MNLFQPTWAKAKPASNADHKWQEQLKSSRTPRLLVTLTSVLIATAVRWALQPLLGPTHPFTFYFAAIALISWYAGFRLSLLAIALSYLLADWLFVTPTYEFDFKNWGFDGFIGLGVFFCTAMAIAFTSKALHAAKERAEARQRELEKEIAERTRVQEALQKAQADLKEHAVLLEERVQERTATLSATIESLEGVCYHIAHDLRAPLRTMAGFSTLLLNKYGLHLDDCGKDYANRVAEAATRMDSLIRSLLEYGRLGHQPLNCSLVDLQAEIDRTLRLLAEDVKAKGAQIAIKRPLPSVWADSNLVCAILTNLLSNAVMFVAPGIAPRIKIWAEEKQNIVRLWIEDNGIGIEPKYREKIFGAFERLHADQEYPGTGIGLAIVAKGIQRMKGRVGVESSPGQGSRFWLELPGSPALHASSQRHSLVLTTI